MYRASLYLGFVCYLAVIGSACESPDAGPAPSTGPTAPVGTGADLLPRSPDLAEYPEPAPGDALAATLYERAQRFARNLEPAGDIERGTVRRGAHSEHFFVAEPGRCYQVFGAGAAGIRDLDLLLFDPEMVLVQQDAAPDPMPMLGLTTPICARQGVRYRVRVRAFRGEGEYGLLVTRTALHLF